MSTHGFGHLRTFWGMNRKLETARVFERLFEIYRDQFTLLIPAALVVFVPVAVLSGLIYAGGVSVLGALVVAAIATIATYWFQGMVVEAARDILDGRRDHTVGSLIRSVTPVVGPLIVAGILAGIGIGIGLLLLIVPGLFLLTIWAVLAPVIVIERKGAIDAFGRSRELVRGNGWQVFSVILVLFILQFAVSAVIQAVADSVSDSFASYAVGDLLLRLLVAPLSALAAAVIFFELKALRGEPVLGTGAGGQVPPAREPAAATAPPASPEAPGAPAGGPETPTAPQPPTTPQPPPPGGPQSP
jgi:ABC-type multidrug transport system fused ATPase/permease subunit